MSRFLAPIHTWLFNKIKLYEELEREVTKTLGEAHRGELAAVVADAYEKYGAPLEEKPLEELIDRTNIHGWLQSRITAAETRQSHIITGMVNSFGEEVKDIVRTIYSEHGRKCGGYAKDNYEVNSPSELYDAMNDFILDGMPCDNVNNVVEHNEEHIIWRSTRCLHRPYWEAVGGDVEFLNSIRSLWVKNFVSSANGSFTYIEQQHDFNGEPGYIREIKRK